MKRFFDLQFHAEGDKPKGGEEKPTGDGDQKEQSGKTFSQADVDRILADRLKREREKYADYDDLKKSKEELDVLKTAQMTEQEKAQARIAELEAKNAETEAKAKALELSTLRTRLLAEAGLPAELADRVKGENEESIKADLEALKKIVKPKDIGGGGVPPASKEQKNPWKRETLNLTEQARILRENPALAASLKASAGA